MNKKTRRRPVARLMAILMALAMVVSVVFMNVSAEKATFAAPTEPMTVDPNQITVAAHSQGYITPEVLGLTNTTSRTQELPVAEDGSSVGMSYSNAQRMAVLGVFGSDINQNPNPYMYNYFYNAYAAENNKTPSPFGTYTFSGGIVNIGPAQAANAGGYSKYGITVPASFYVEPEILLGIGPINSDGTTGYTAKLKEYNEAKQASTGTTDVYAPYEVAYESDHVYSFLQSLYDLSDIVDAIKAEDSSKTTRYSDPQIISGDVEKYVKGLEAYVIKRLKADNAEPLTVAVVDTAYTTTARSRGVVPDGSFVVNDKTCSTQRTTNFSRAGEFIADTATNIIDALPTKPERQDGTVQGDVTANEYYVVTADQIAEYADVIIFADVMSSVPENTGNSQIDNFMQDLSSSCSTAELRAKVNDIEVMSSTFDCVGSIGANSVENLLGMAYYTAYLYPQYLNQFDVAAYWYQNFYHVSDLNKLQSVMVSNFATSSVQDAYAGQYSATNMNYSKEDVEAKIIEGMHYYEDNENEFTDKLIYQNGRNGESTGWDIDWTRGIGAETEPVTVTLTADKTTAEEKTYVKLTAAAAEGTAPYTYKFSVTNNANGQTAVLEDFSSANTVNWYTGPAASKTLKVEVKDATGATAQATLPVTITAKTANPLTVSSFTSSNGVSLTEKTNTTLEATANGGQGSYTYKFIVYNQQTKQWYKIRDFESTNTCDWYTGAAGTKTLYVDVKDSAGTVERKALDVTVKSDQEPLKGKLSSSKGDSLNAKDTTTLIAEASGGSGSGYTYKFIVYNTETNQWYRIQDYSTQNTASWYTGVSGKKILYLDVKDGNGGYVRTPLNVTVK